MNINKYSLEKALLYALIGGALILSPIGSKVVIALAQYYVKKWWEKGGPYIPPENNQERVRESLYKLKRNNYIEWKYYKKSDVVKLKLTKKGTKFFGQIKFVDLRIQTQNEWDGQWRFFMFDIPEKKKRLRDSLRAKLKDIGFFRFQKSVWVYPFECEKEARYICEYLEITPYTTMFTARIDKDRTLRRYFLKQGTLLRRHLSLADKGIRY